MRHKMQSRHYLAVVGLCSILVMVSRAHAVDVADSWEADQLKQHDIQACVPAGASTPEPMSAYDEHTIYRDEDCDDGNICNGSETCSGSQRFKVGDEWREVHVCKSSGQSPCTQGEICVKRAYREGYCVAEECAHGRSDADGDGHARPECGGDDCDDSDPNRFPGNAEVCDEDGYDEDCDPSTIGDKDLDEDGHVDQMCRNYMNY